MKSAILIVFAILMSLPTLEAQTSTGKFVVGRNPSVQYHENFSDHKIWVQVINDDPSSTHDYTFQYLIWADDNLQLHDYAAKGYTRTYVPVGALSAHWLLEKTVTLAYEEVATEVLYFNTFDEGFKVLWMPVRVKDENGNYLLRYDQGTDFFLQNASTQWSVPFDFFDAHDANLFDNDLGSSPAFIKDVNINAFNDVDDPFLIKPPHSYSDNIHWYVLGKVFIDVTGSYESEWPSVIDDTYETWDENFSIPDNPGLHRMNEIILIDEQSQFAITGETHFIGDLLQVVSGVRTDEFWDKTVHMGGGLLVGSDATLTLNNSLVQDQMEGITLEAGATLNANDTYFTDNLVSIRVKAGDPNKITKINLSQVQFAGIGQLKTSPESRNYPFAHIKIDPGAKVEINIANQTGLGVKMLQADYGIYSEGDLVTINGAEINYEYKAVSVLGLGGYNYPIVSDGWEFLDHEYFVGGTLSVPLIDDRERGIGIYSTTDDPAYSQHLTVNATSTIPLKIIYPNVGIELDDATSNMRNVYIKDAQTIGINAYSNMGLTHRNLSINDSEIDMAEVGINIKNYYFFGNSLLIDNIVSKGIDLYGQCSFRLFDSEVFSQNIGIRFLNTRDGLAQIKDCEIDATLGIYQLLAQNNNTHISQSTITSKSHGFLSAASSLTLNILRENTFEAFSIPATFNVSSAITNRTRTRISAYENVVNLKGAKYGVNLLNTDYNLFEDNFVEFSGSQSASYNKGIGMNIKCGVSNNLICNTINQQIIGTSIGTIGIASNISQMNLLRDNNIHDLSVGIQFYNQNSDAEVIGNYIDGHIFGLSYGEETSQGYNIAFTGDQIRTGNQWFDENNVFGYEDANFYGTSDQADESAYFVNPNHNPVTGAKSRPDDINPGGQTWFKNDPFNLNYTRSQTCSSLDLITPQRLLASEGQINFLKMNYDSINFGHYDEEIKANYYRIFYKELLKENVDFTFTESQINYRLDQLGVNKDLVEVQYLIESTLGGEIKTFAQQDSLITSIEGIEAELLNYFALPDTAITALATKWAEITSMYEDIYSGGDTINYSILETALTSLPNRHLYTDAENTLHYVLLGQVRYMKGDTTSYINMRPTIMDIALSCPFEFGEAVYIARALVGDDYPLSYEDFSMCDEDNLPRSKKDTQSYGELKVYPVPSAGELTIELPDGAERMEIYSTEGKLIRTINIVRMNRTEINLLNSGVYQIQVHKIDGSIDHQRVIIVK